MNQVIQSKRLAALLENLEACRYAQERVASDTFNTELEIRQILKDNDIAIPGGTTYIDVKGEDKLKLRLKTAVTYEMSQAKAAQALMELAEEEGVELKKPRAQKLVAQMFKEQQPKFSKTQYDSIQMIAEAMSENQSADVLTPLLAKVAKEALKIKKGKTALSVHYEGEEE